MSNKKDLIEAINKHIKKNKKRLNREDIKFLETIREKIRQALNDVELSKWLEVLVKFLTAAAATASLLHHIT